MSKKLILFPRIGVVFKSRLVFGATYNLQFRLTFLFIFHYWKTIDFTFPHIHNNDMKVGGWFLLRTNSDAVLLYFSEEFYKSLNL